MKRTVQLLMLVALLLGLAPGPLVRSAVAAELAPGVELLSGIGLDFVQVAAAGHYAYVLEHNGGLRIIDLSDPARPQQRGHLPLGLNHERSGLTVVGSYAYICDRVALRIVDVAHPDHPRAIWNSAGPCRDVEVVGNLAYVVADEAGLSIFDISNPANPQVAGTVHMMDGIPMHNLAISGSQLFILGNYGASSVGGRLWVFEVSNPARPTLKGTLNGSAYRDVVVRDGLLYIVAARSLDVVSIGNPGNPTLINRHELDWGARIVQLGRYLYLDYQHDTLQIYDVGEAHNPTLVQAVNVLTTAYVDLATSGNLLLMVDMYGGLRVFRMTPERYPAPAEVCFTQTQHCISGRFREYWEQNGGLPVFGYPITDVREEYNTDTGAWYRTQWFERNRFELHPKNQRPYDVLLGRLGAADWGGDAVREPGPRSGCLWFAETGHNVCNQAGSFGFMSYWQSHGLDMDGRAGVSYAESLALFGYPLTEPTVVHVNGTPRMMQWFERARFEWHPDNPNEYKVLLGLLGVERKIP